MPIEMDDVQQASRLIKWGLRPRERPAQQPQYRQLIERYLEFPDLREAVEEVAEGLDLKVLDVSPRGGIVLAPYEDSVFALRPADFSPSSSGADDRLIHGLIQVALAALIYPRARDLDEEEYLARQPVSVEEVERSLRDLCDRFEEEAREEPDPEAGEEMEGLYEAWRVYHNRMAAKETPGNRRARRTTRRMIERTLERLCELGCFLRQDGEQGVEYQPTRRYQTQVQRLGATRLYQHVQERM